MKKMLITIIMVCVACLATGCMGDKFTQVDLSQNHVIMPCEGGSFDVYSTKNPMYIKEFPNGEKITLDPIEDAGYSVRYSNDWLTITMDEEPSFTLHCEVSENTDNDNRRAYIRIVGPDNLLPILLTIDQEAKE